MILIKFSSNGEISSHLFIQNVSNCRKQPLQDVCEEMSLGRFHVYAFVMSCDLISLLS